jgi:hypothetical protein
LTRAAASTRCWHKTVPRVGGRDGVGARVVAARRAHLAAAHNGATHAVTLTLGKLKSTDKKGTLEVMGVADPAGDVLVGTAVFAVNLRPKRKH